MKKKLMTLLACTIISMAMLTGCTGESSSDNQEYTGAYKGAESMTNDDTYDTAGNGFNSSDYVDESIQSDITFNDKAENSTAENNADDGTAESTGKDNNTENNNEIKEESDNKIDQEKLIYSCDINIDTIDYEESLNKFRNLVNQYDGFIEFENERDNAETLYYDSASSYREETKRSAKHYSYEARVRIPSKDYHKFLDEAGGIGDVRSKNANVENVSTEYYDLKAELEVLNTKYNRYLDLMKKAKSTSEILQIEQSLSSVETQLNQIKTRMNRIDNDVAYSYVTVNITQVKEYEPEEEEGFLSQWNRAIKDSASKFIDFIKGLIIFFTYALPYLIILAIILIVCIKASMKNMKKKAMQRSKNATAFEPITGFMYKQKDTSNQITQPTMSPISQERNDTKIEEENDSSENDDTAEDETDTENSTESE